MTSLKQAVETAAPKRVHVVLANGAEEMETVIVVDVLRRAGLEVSLLGIDGADAVAGSRGIRIVPDAELVEPVADCDAWVLPGGMRGTQRLADSELLGQILARAEREGKLVGAICAAAFALAKHNVFAGRRMSCHPSVEDTVAAHAVLSREGVVRDGNLITARGPGKSFGFALALVGALLGPGKAAEISAEMLLEEA